MSDVVLGALIGVLAAGTGAILQGMLSQRAQVAAEQRSDQRRRRERDLEARLLALDQTHRMLVTGAEHARASAVGEAAEQVAHLRRAVESSNFLEADVTLLGDPELVAAYLERTRWWITQQKTVRITANELQVDAELANRIQHAFREARQRIVRDVDSEDALSTDATRGSMQVPTG